MLPCILTLLNNTFSINTNLEDADFFLLWAMFLNFSIKNYSVYERRQTFSILFLLSTVSEFVCLLSCNVEF